MPRNTAFISLKALILILLLLGPSVPSWAVGFEDVIKNPSKFHDKRVTLRAMAEVGGDRFYLFRPLKPRSLGEDGRVIYGVLRTEAPVYDRFTSKWVEVTGIIDANYRGLVSENACSLIIERVRPIGRIEKPKLSYAGASCLEIKFSQLLESSKSYEHKCVCVTGFAHVHGDAFAIYESEKVAQGRDHPDYKKGIFVSPASDRDYDRYNKRWIKIRGAVDMNQRGFADYPCGIVVDRVEPASPK